MTFHDHFSGHAGAYARARPTYPAELFTWLASLTEGHNLAWDCGTGNGQAAKGLAGFYAAVLATDASSAQIAQASTHRVIRWEVGRENASRLEPGSVDLVTAAQALHWFDAAAFFAESRRVLCQGGVLAAWCYGLQRVTPEVDAVVDQFYSEKIGPWWPPERKQVENGYREIPFPFEEITAPRYTMRSRLNLAGMLAYIATWSSVQRYRKEAGVDPMPGLAASLSQSWGDPAALREVRWPVAMRVGRHR
jgi:SAM-dependent methyltransferase